MLTFVSSFFSSSRAASRSFVSLAISVLPAIIGAQTSTSWSTDSKVNNAVVIKANNQQYHQSIVDSAGNNFICWIDSSTSRYYVQKVSSQGSFLWDDGGVQVSQYSGDKECQLYSDGAGGVIVIWSQNSSSSYIYGQRITSDKSLAWGLNGKAIYSAKAQKNPKVLPTGTGEAIVVWQDAEISSNPNIVSRKINVVGEPVWTTTVCAEPGVQEQPQIVSDGNGGAYICWLDRRSASHVYAQHLLSGGAIDPQWDPLGLLLSPTQSNALQLFCAEDENGGLVAVWQETNTSNYDIFGQRIDSQGVKHWGVGPLQISTAAGNQSNPHVTVNSDTEALIVWYDPSSNNGDIICRRVADNGQFVGTETQLTNTANIQYAPSICTDGNGGAVVAWLDKQSLNGRSDVYAQKIDRDGLIAWITGPVPVCDHSLDQIFSKIVPAISGGAIISWWDNRNGSTSGYDIYASRINSDGTLGPPPPPAASAPAAPTNLAITDNGASLGLTWADNASNETGYKIMRSINGATATQLADLSPDTTSYTDTDINNCSLYSYTVVAYNDEGSAASDSAEHNNAVTPTITVFGDNPVTVPYGRPYYDAGASATDGCGNHLSITATGINAVDTSALGTYTITYSTTHNGQTHTATRTVNVVKADQSLTFTVPAQKTYGDAPLTLTATSSSGLSVEFSVNGPATLAGNILTITGAGTVTVTAAQPGNQYYNASPSVVRTITINKANAAISVIGYNGTYDGQPHTATGTARGIEAQPADLTALLTITGSFTETPGGTATWTFAGNDKYLPASGSVAITIRPLQSLRPAPPVRP